MFFMQEFSEGFQLKELTNRWLYDNFFLRSASTVMYTITDV